MRSDGPRRGALLPTVLAVMVIIALAATAALHMSRQERRSSSNARFQIAALASVDAAHAIGLEQAYVLAPMLEPGASILRRVPLADSAIAATVRLTRLGKTLYALTADARASAPEGEAARRRASLVLRLEPANVPFPAALNASGASAPAAELADGVDRAPAAWPCPDPLKDVAPVAHPSPTIDSVLLGDLRTRASIRLPAGSAIRLAGPVVRDGECATERPDNWGDASGVGVCGSYMPIIHAAGDLRVDGGAGQGMLLVDGNLSMSGGFEFTGAVIVSGSIDVGPGGALLTGGAVAAGVTDASGAGGSRPIVVRSSCALGAALLAAGALVPVVDRPWVSVR